MNEDITRLGGSNNGFWDPRIRTSNPKGLKVVQTLI